jgi:hypothetical protein
MDTPNDEEQRINWRWQWLSAIQAFADIEVQRRRWTDPHERNPHYSFVECMCSYFDDAFMDEENAYDRRVSSGRLSFEEAGVMAQFHSVAEAYKPPEGDYYATEAILADPAWQKVVRLAQEAQQRLSQLLTDPAERASLTQLLEWHEKNGVYYTGRTGSSYIR